MRLTDDVRRFLASKLSRKRRNSRASQQGNGFGVERVETGAHAPGQRYGRHCRARSDQIGTHQVPHLLWPVGLIVLRFGIPAPTGQLARPLLSLPKGQDLLIICFLVIVGKAEPFNPVAAPAVSRNDAPGASRCVTPVAQTNTGGDADRIGFLPNVELETRGARLKLSDMMLRAIRHSVSRECPVDGSGRL